MKSKRNICTWFNINCEMAMQEKNKRLRVLKYNILQMHILAQKKRVKMYSKKWKYDLGRTKHNIKDKGKN